ncbi:MAG TPA: hypothetical protein VFW98_03655 [Gemmatimonadaceae bacterium]|nr:hypothetical protein [Gemmatimonadaceae bacterium]
MEIAFVAPVAPRPPVACRSAQAHRGTRCLPVLLVLVALLAAAAPAAAQDTVHIRGRITVAGTATPIPFAEVWVVRDHRMLKQAHAVADSAGLFAVSVTERGPYALYIRRIGFVPLVTPVAPVVDSTLQFHLSPMAARLPATTVTGTDERRNVLLQGFDRRRQLGIGTFLTYEDIRERGAPPLPILLREVPGVEIQGSGDEVTVQMGRTSTIRSCTPQIYLDGTRATHSTDPPTVAGRLISGIRGEDLEAIEIYRGRSELPAVFGDPDARCGAIVIWTRRPSLHGKDSGQPPRER